MTLLATTALEWTWGDRESVVFLGEWCRRYQRRAFWQARNHIVVRNHWDDRAKLRNDEIYLHRLHDALLGDLAIALGRLHGLERSKRFWQILLDPWLARYLGVAFDRWESLRVALAEYDISKTVIRATPRCPLARDHLHFAQLVSSDDDWNHDFFADILRREYSRKCDLVVRTELPVGDSTSYSSKRGEDWRWRIANRVDHALGWWSRDSDFAFIQSYFPFAVLAKLCLRLGQLPSFLRSEFKWPDPSLAVEYSSAIRQSLVLRREPRNAFEAFLQERISQDLPQVVVESFEPVRKRAAAIRLRPKVVLTSTAHWFNDLFKHWVAEKVHEGVRFVVMEHGGALPPQFGAMDFEEDIADVKTTWALPYHAKHVRLPANKLIGRRRPATGERLVVVGSEMPRYPFAVAATPMAGQTLLGFEYVCRMHDALDEAPQRAFLVKPYAEFGWCLRERFSEHFGPPKVSVERRLEKVMDCARMVVCTYPQTTFSEALSRRIPTLLVYPPHLWETIERFDGLIEELRAARMLFFDPDIAARHINSVWTDPMAWWESSETRAARLRFEAEAVDLRPDWIESWCAFAEHIRAAQSQRLPTGSQQHPRVS